MNECYPIMPRSELVIPEEVIDLIHHEQDQLADDLPLVVEHELIKNIVMTANGLLDEHYKKPPIQVNEWHVLQPNLNCTDTSMVQLGLMEALGYEGVVKFNGAHASTILPIGDHFWSLENELTHHISVSSKPKPTTDMRAVHATERALNLLEQHEAVYVYTDEDGAWLLQPVDGQKIRSSSPLLTHRTACADPSECDITGRLLVKAPLAYDMLHALDALQQLRDAEKSVRTNRAYLVAKEILKELVPYVH